MPEVTGDGKLKKEKVTAPPTKVVVRHLPPFLTEEEFLDVVSPLPSHNWLEFYDTEKSLTGHDFRRAYINFTDVEEIHGFRDQYDGYVFVDQKGNESQAIVEFAPFQKLSRRDQSPKRKDPRMATIQDDPDYIEFLHKLQNPETVQLPGTEKMLEEIEAQERTLRENHGVPTTRTPLVEYLEQRRADTLQHKLDARSQYDHGGRQGERMRRREEKRLQRLERRKGKLETAGRRNKEVLEDEYYDEEDEDYDQMDDEEDGEYHSKSSYSKSRTAPAGSKFTKRKELPSILAKRARRTERRRKEREERAQLEEQQHKRPSGSQHTSSAYYSSGGKEGVPVKRSKDGDDDDYYEKAAAGDEEQWEGRTPLKRGPYESSSASKRQAGDRNREPVEERTRGQGKGEQPGHGTDVHEVKGKRYSVLKRKLEEKKQSSSLSTRRSEVRRADAADVNDVRSTNNKNDDSNGNGTLSSSDTVKETDQSGLGTSTENSSKSDMSTSKNDDSSVQSFGGSRARREADSSFISDESSPRSLTVLKPENNDSKLDDHSGKLPSIDTEEKTDTPQPGDDALKAKKERLEEEAEDERERDKSVERITRSMEPSAEGERKESGEGSNAASPKNDTTSPRTAGDDTTSPRTVADDTKQKTGSDPRTERKIRNKDRPAMQLYRPGQTRLASRLKQDSGGGRTGDGAVSAGSGSVGSGGGRSSSSSTSSPEVPVEEEGRVEAEEPDTPRSTTTGRGRSVGGRESPLTGANRIRLTKEPEQPRKKVDRSSDYGSERKLPGKAGGDKKYRDNYYEEDDGKVYKNLSGKGDSHIKTRKFSKTNEYDSKYSRPSVSNRGKTSDYESGTIYSKSASSKYPKSRYDTQQHPIKNTPSRSFRGKFERDDQQPTSSRADSSRDSSVLEDHGTVTVAAAAAAAASKEAKPQGKRYSRMRAADGVRSTSITNKGKEVVEIFAEDHQLGDSAQWHQNSSTTKKEAKVISADYIQVGSSARWHPSSFTTKEKEETVIFAEGHQVSDSALFHPSSFTKEKEEMVIFAEGHQVCDSARFHPSSFTKEKEEMVIFAEGHQVCDSARFHLSSFTKEEVEIFAKDRQVGDSVIRSHPCSFTTKEKEEVVEIFAESHQFGDSTTRSHPSSFTTKKESDIFAKKTTSGSKEAKPQGKRYSKMRAASRVRSTSITNKRKKKIEVVEIFAEDHQVADSAR